MKASLNNYRQSPRKVRLIAGLISGKKIADAQTELQFLVKRGALPIAKLLSSAIANAKNAGMDVANLIVKEIRVDKGVTMKRSMPRARGSASRINKRASHILIVLGEKEAKVKTGGKKVKVSNAENKEVGKMEDKKITKVKKAPKKVKATEEK